MAEIGVEVSKAAPTLAEEKRGEEKKPKEEAEEPAAPSFGAGVKIGEVSSGKAEAVVETELGVVATARDEALERGT